MTNPQEYEALGSLLAQLVEIHGVRKDPDAELLIREAVARQPDAPYILVQRTLLLHAALAEARRRIAVLQNSQRQESTSDALRTLGSPPEGAAPQAPDLRRLDLAAPPPRAAYATPTVSPVSASGGATPSFLGQAAATAAGVAGGAFLFHGVEDLLGHHGSALSGHDIAAPAEDVTVNNYYGSEPGDEREAALDRDSAADDFADTDDDFV